MVPRITTIPAHSAVDLLATVAVPDDAAGGYTTTVFISSLLEEDLGALASAPMGTRIGVVVLLEVEGTTEPGLKVGEITYVPPSLDAPARVEARATNTGNVHLPLTLRGVIRGTDGDVLGTVASSAPKYALPGETVSVFADWTKAASEGAYEFAGAVMYGPDLLVPVVYPLVVPAGAGAPPGR